MNFVVCFDISSTNISIKRNSSITFWILTEFFTFGQVFNSVPDQKEETIHTRLFDNQVQIEAAEEKWNRHEAKGKRGVSERKVSYRWKRSEVR